MDGREAEGRCGEGEGEGEGRVGWGLRSAPWAGVPTVTNTVDDHCPSHTFPHSPTLQSLSYLDEDFLMQLEGLYLDKAHEVKLPVRGRAVSHFSKLPTVMCIHTYGRGA